MRDFVRVHVICVFLWGKVLELLSGSQRHHARGWPHKFSPRLRHFGHYKGKPAGIKQELSVLVVERVITTDWKPGPHGVYALMGRGGLEKQEKWKIKTEGHSMSKGKSALGKTQAS